MTNMSGFSTFSNFSDIYYGLEVFFAPPLDRGFHKDSKNGLEMALALKLSEL